MIKSLLAISAGASAGAIIRWGLGLALNAVFPPLPLGTLAANWIGGYFIGLAIGVFGAFATLGPEWRLLVITGFLGGLTTFSTYSAEIMILLQQQRFGMAAAAFALHNIGSVCLAFGGMWSFAFIRSVLQ